MTVTWWLKTSANKPRDDARSGIGPAARAMPVDTPATQNPADAIRRSLRLIGAALTLNGVLFLLGSFATGQWLLDSAGRLADSDFVDVWAAGKLALDGNAAAAWDWAIHRDAEVAALGHDFPGNYGWHYPPTFLFVRRSARHVALPCSLACLARGDLADVPRRGPHHHGRAPRHPHRLCVPRRDVEHAGRAERISHRRADRLHAGVPRHKADRRRGAARLSDLQAAIRHPVSACAGGERAMARDRGGRHDNSGPGRGVDCRVRSCGVGRFLHVVAGDKRDHPRRRPRRPQQAAKPVRPGALARRQHDGRLDRARSADRRLCGCLGDAHQRPPRAERGEIGGARDGRVCSRRPISTSTIFPC